MRAVCTVVVVLAAAVWTLVVAWAVARFTA
jgi:hypothetical protein